MPPGSLDKLKEDARKQKTMRTKMAAEKAKEQLEGLDGIGEEGKVAGIGSETEMEMKEEL